MTNSLQWAATSIAALVSFAAFTANAQTPSPELVSEKLREDAAGSFHAESWWDSESGMMFQPAIRADLPESAPFRSFPEIRVRVFPHLNNHEPQKKDTRISRVTLETESECRVFSATSSPPAKGDRLISSGKSIALSSAELSSPRWIECDSPARIVRESGRTSYSYRGDFHVRRISTGRNAAYVEIVNILPFDEYLKGVVPIEMPARWHPEALKAQAVAARTYAYYHVALARAAASPKPWDVDDTTWYQAYTGTLNEAASTSAAVDGTSGQLITSSGKVIQAFFSADSGGYTESASNVWGVSVPYCLAKKELYEDGDLDLTRWGPWSTAASLSALNTKLIGKGIVTRANPARSLSVSASDRTESGRAKTISVVLRNGRPKKMDGNAFRSMLGLKSTLISSLSIESGGADPTYRITGRGHGHGVGMSQIGAQTLASVLGKGHLGILTFYYSDVQVCTVDASAATAEIQVCGE